MAKKAVLIGCNYRGTKAQLKGCVNDVLRMHRCLIDRYGFSEGDITVLIDTDDSYTKPTGGNIRRALAELVQSAEPGDVLYVHFSGHGTRLPAEEDDTGYDECIVPSDMNLITDDEIRDLVDQVPQGCRITIVSDSCNSGGLIDGAKEQIGESTRRNADTTKFEQNLGLNNFSHRKLENALYSPGIRLSSDEEVGGFQGEGDFEYVRSKLLPLPTLIDILKQKTGKDDIDVGNLRPSLIEAFGEDVSPKVKKFVKFIMDKLHHDGCGEREAGSGDLLGMVGNLAQQFHRTKVNGRSYAKPDLETQANTKQEVYGGARSRSLKDSGILISGCQTDQISGDVTLPGKPRKSYGALSNAIQTIIEESDGVISNYELVIKAREILKKKGYTQRPGLYCSDKYVDERFIC